MNYLSPADQENLYKAAHALMRRLDRLTTAEFGLGDDRPEREALRAVLAQVSHKDRLNVTIGEDGVAYSDEATVVGGGSQGRVAFLSFRTLDLTVFRPTSPLLLEIRRQVAALQARRGERFKVEGDQYVVLGL